MSKKLNILVLSLFIFSLFFLISSNANAGVMEPIEIPTYEPIKSDCCFAHEGGHGCEVWLEGTEDAKGICCDKLDGNEQNALSEPCLEAVEELTGEWDGDGWTDDDDDDDSFAGCDNSVCENTVCQINPSCCVDEIIYHESKEIGGGWDKECADLANLHCAVCNGPLVIDNQQATDEDPFQLYSYMDLRDRETFVQVTNDQGSPVTVHVQIFDVSNNCNENNFFDSYTGNDTHVYNMRNITTNDGTPSGVVLPDNAYGMVVVTVVDPVTHTTLENSVIVGNFRILDDTGYEYRTNMIGIRMISDIFNPNVDFYFNYNIKGNVTLSDVVGLTIQQDQADGGVTASPQNAYAAFDIDIYNNNENVFSCRDIIFACIDDDSPLVDQLLEDVGVGAVASFDYGINEAIPHSRGGDVLCSGNNISEGIVVLRPEEINLNEFIGYVGLNNGNGRGSMDSFWQDNFLIVNQQQLIPAP